MIGGTTIENKQQSSLKTEANIKKWIAYAFQEQTTSVTNKLYWPQILKAMSI